MSIELNAEYIAGSLGRFGRDAVKVHDSWLNEILMNDDYTELIVGNGQRRTPDGEE
jgi:hypothetical protein